MRESYGILKTDRGILSLTVHKLDSSIKIFESRDTCEYSRCCKIKIVATKKIYNWLLLAHQQSEPNEKYFDGLVQLKKYV